MTKQSRIFILVLIMIIAILTASTSFLFFQNRRLAQQLTGKKNVISSEATQAIKSPEVSTQIDTSVATPPPSNITKPASESEKPSHPTDTYKVQPGETLLEISQKNSSTLSAISEANGLDDADKIQAEQVLIIPKNDQVAFTVDNNQVSNLQKQAEQDKVQFRLNPEETSRSDAPSVYGLTVNDEYKLKNKDDNAGTATVTGSHESKNYLIKLVQPGTKGNSGIWAIESITPVS